ncbi:MAG TPA: hypothetical protein VF345_05160 [Chthoniobacterales bacterium]
MDIRRILTLATFLAPFLSQQISAGELTDAAPWPDVCGYLGVQGYAPGERMAPNGVVFDPRFRSDFNLNLSLLPRKKLYVFLETEFWMQRSSPATTDNNQVVYNFSKREFDINTGFAWNIFDRLELRVSADALNNLNRGNSRTEASGNTDGGQFEARYYFGPASIYDVGQLNFVGIGYNPSHNLIGGDGLEFRAGMFAQAYATYSIPALRSYLYGHATLIEQEYGNLRLVTFDAGIATRPFSRVQDLEFRLGNELTADIQAGTTRDLIYGALRAYYGPSSDASKDIAGQIHEVKNWPEVWGYFGLSAYATGDRVAPNGVPFDPIFRLDVNFNVGILSKKKLYFFLENEFWVQRATAAGVTDLDPTNADVSQREFDLHGGLAWNVFGRFELRASAYGLNNLNRAGSPGTSGRDPSKTQPTGYRDGTQVELRYYLDDAHIYDPGRLSFVGIGLYPANTLIGGDGVSFHPGFFARAHASYDIPKLRSYLYGDAMFIAQKPASARLIIFDAGLAARPFSRIDNLEFRIGNELTADVEANTTRDLTYGAIRLNFSTR